MAMKHRRIIYGCLWGLALLAIVTGDLRAWYLHRAAQPDDAQVLAAIPDGAGLRAHDDPLPYWGVHAPDGALLGLAFVTAHAGAQQPGFNAPVNLLVGLLPGGDIATVSILEHRESPAYMAMIRRGGLLEDLAGRSVATDPKSLDAISGATITSRAIQRQTLTSGATVARQVLGLDIPTPPANTTGGLIDVWQLGALALALLLAAGASLKPDPRLRRFSLAAGFMVLGLYLNCSLTFGHLAGVLKLSTPTLANMSLILVMLFAVGFALGGKRAYCRNLCPFGAAQEALFFISPAKLEVTPKLQRTAGVIRFIILVAALWALLFFGLGEAAELEPFAHLFGRGMSVSLWIYAALALGLSAFVPRFWCRFFCPTGAMLELMARLRYYVKRRGAAPATLEDDHEPR